MAAGGRASRPTAGPVLSRLPAPSRAAGAPSRCIATNRFSPGPGPNRPTLLGLPPTGADRPIVERKISHFTRRAWGARKARTRGLKRISTDLDTRAGALNWARLAILGLHLDANGWAIG